MAMKPIIDCRACDRTMSFPEWVAHRIDCARRAVRAFN